MRYKIVSVSRNAAPWLDKSLRSIADQRDQPFDVCVIDDASDDGISRGIIRDWCAYAGWECVLNDERRGAMENQCHAIDLLDCKPDDVIVICDGDDRLAHANVLNRLAIEYVDPRVQLTYGNYTSDPFSPTCAPARAYPQDVIDKRSFRKAIYTVGVLFNHLRTFRAGPFMELDRDLRFKWRNGEWFDCCPDGAIMLPLLEMVGRDHRFIDEVLYLYTSSNPTSEWRERPKRIDKTYRYIYDLPPVEPWTHHG